MKITKELFNKILAAYIIMQPLLDIFTGLITKIYGNTLSIGVIIRTLFMAGIALYAIYVANKKDKIKLIGYYSAVGVYALLFLLLAYNRYQLTSIFIQIKGIIKVIYFPVVLAALYAINKENEIKIDSKIIKWALFIYTFSIFFGKVTGLSFNTYNSVKRTAGTAGLFYSANEIGAVLCMLAPFLINDFIKRKGNNIFNIISIILLIFAVLEIGTKVPLIGVFGAIIGAIIVSIILYFKEKKFIHIKNIIYSFVTIVLCFFVIGYTPAGINLEDAYGPIFPKIVKGRVEEQTGDKIESFEDFQSVFTSKRSDVLKWNKESFEKENLSYKVFGTGYLHTKDGEITEKKLVEMDYFDIFFNHGLIGMIIIFAPTIFLLWLAAKSVFLNIKKVLVDADMIYTCYSVLMGILVALLAGHVLTAPAVSFFLAIALLEVVKKDYKLSK